MTVPDEKGKAGAHRKGGLVLMWARRQKRCVPGRGRAVCGTELSLGYSIGSVQQSGGLGEFTVSDCVHDLEGEEPLCFMGLGRCIFLLCHFLNCR